VKDAVPPPADENAFRELIRTFGLAERLMQPYFARFGISGSQWGVLRNLQRAEQSGLAGLRLSELSERMLMAAGVDGIMSDYPDRLVAATKKESHGGESGTADRRE